MLILGVIVFSSLSLLVLNTQTRLEVKSVDGDGSKGLKFKSCADLVKTKGHYISSHGLMDSANYIFVEDIGASTRAMQGYGFLSMFQNVLKRYVLMPNCQIEGTQEYQIPTIYVQSGLISTATNLAYKFRHTCRAV